MLNAIQNEEQPAEAKQWWVKHISVDDIVNNLECENFSISEKLNAGNELLVIAKKDLTNIVQDIADGWCEAQCGAIITKDDLALFK
tara:strand:- start:2637 stop:2894 length:258 start_codon:yes stop_codon:yes gene_type:complete